MNNRILPESHFPFPEQSFKHKESAILEIESKLLLVVSGMEDNTTPRPLLASLFGNLRFPLLISSFLTRLCSSPFLDSILFKQSS